MQLETYHLTELAKRLHHCSVLIKHEILRAREMRRLSSIHRSYGSGNGDNAYSSCSLQWKPIVFTPWRQQTLPFFTGARHSLSADSLAFVTAGPLIRNILHLHKTLEKGSLSGSSDDDDEVQLQLPSAKLNRIVTRDQSENHQPGSLHNAPISNYSDETLVEAKQRVSKLAHRFIAVSSEVQAKLQSQESSMPNFKRSVSRLQTSIKSGAFRLLASAVYPTSPNALLVEGVLPLECHHLSLFTGSDLPWSTSANQVRCKLYT
jgi:hypothetical protein